MPPIRVVHCGAGMPYDNNSIFDGITNIIIIIIIRLEKGERGKKSIKTNANRLYESELAAVATMACDNMF